MISFLRGHEVQEAAAMALTTLCRANRVISDTVLAATHPQQAAPVPHAFRLLAHQNARLALAAAELLHALAASAPSEVLEQLLQPSNIGLSGLVASMRFWSLQSCSAGAPAGCVKLLQVLLLMLHSLVVPADGCSKMPAGLAKALLKVQVMVLLLEFVQAHRGRGAPAIRADAGGGSAVSGHAAVVKEALGLLTTILSQGPTIRRKFKEAEGVQRVLAVLREFGLPWSVKLQAVAALAAAAPAPHVADQIGEHGLDLVAGLLQHVVSSGLQEPGAEQLLDLMKVVMVGARTTGSWLTDHQAIPAFQAVLGALGWVASTEAVLSRQEAAMSAVQVLFQLSCHWPAEIAAIPPGQEASVTTLLFHFIAPAAALHITDIANSAPDARLMHIALCALGVMGKNTVLNRWTWSFDQVSQMINLLRISAPAVLKAVCVPNKTKEEEAHTETAKAAADEDANDKDEDDEGSMQLPQLAGHAYLADERVAADFRAAMPAVLQLIAKMISYSVPECRNHLLQLGMVNAVKRFTNWVEVKSHVESVLLLLGQRFGPYRPCTDYTAEELRELLASQGVASESLVAQGGFDSHMLLVLGTESSKRNFPEMLELIECKLKGLNTSHAEKVKLIRTCDAYKLFGEIDLMDRKLDGCITGEDLKKYLGCKGISAPEAQQDLLQLIFPEQQVQPNQPVNFMHFVRVYPTLHSKLITYGVSTKANNFEQPAPSPTCGTGAAPPSAGADSAAAAAAVGGANAGPAADEPSIPHWPPKRARDIHTPAMPAAKHGSPIGMMTQLAVRGGPHLGAIHNSQDACDATGIFYLGQVMLMKCALRGFGPRPHRDVAF
ncbi:hypothetical protein VOLCADRAFT_89736 [Volvox carteri f. nagariensis]|uniref:EF-hand domain-containing protein n=1 Tax=Volvox carteri f. nagariensis TaxID=3068 RepID=D8TSI0_VOLCA|nr:uncharacterized protein VOLCADRAFT_89736 [Volvox carteri f. nagariensis]EFJ49490.1 hypothetical protein VOLCADRAFT_89736 [Volvox carteri f. nagariensis]|eukprot:XP_002949471.1 hypothetical protein VOLCADRAFT_89736 [Volvox carteri f. nagariensis]